MGLFGIALAGVALSFGVTKGDLHALLEAGLSDRTIVHFIHQNGPAEPLSLEDATALKQAGASDTVLRAMAEGSRTADVLTPSHPDAIFQGSRGDPELK